MDPSRTNLPNENQNTPVDAGTTTVSDPTSVSSRTVTSADLTIPTASEILEFVGIPPTSSS
jgi:hypothetical protein